MAFATICFGAVVLLGVLGFVGGIAWWAQHQRERNLALFSAVTQRLGLTLDGVQQASGPWGRGRLVVQLTSERRGSGKNARTVSVTRYRVHPPVPLRMGLTLHNKVAFFGDLADVLGLSKDIQVGRADLDDPMRIGALDADHARRVLSEDGCVRAILSARALNRFYVADHEAFAQHDGWVIDEGTLSAFARPLGAVIDALTDARARHRAGWEDRIDAAFRSVAQTEDMQYRPEHTTLSAALPSGAVTLSVAVTKGALVTHAELTVAQPLGHGIEMYRAGLTDGLTKMFGGQDITLGVPELDDAYTVKARNDVAARALLSGLGADLARLHQTFATLHVTDASVRASGPQLLTDPAELTAVVRALGRVGQALSGSNGGPRGAFR